MGVQRLLDEYFPTHGNWQGLSLGHVAVAWLTHILSEADHRLNQVQQWAEKRLITLRECIKQPVRALDFSDDRLGDVLGSISEDEGWKGFEKALSQRLIRVYELKTDRVRLDSTTVSGYWEISPEGLFQLGHSKDRRPDLPQVKVALAALDPLGMPIATDVVEGNRADDPLYIPSISRVRQSVGERGLLYVGDCKMAAFETRAYVCAGGDYYLCPMSEKQVSVEELRGYLTGVRQGVQSLTPIYRDQEGAERELIAEGFQREETLTAVVEGESTTWKERRLVVRSTAQAASAEKGLRGRLDKAKRALIGLNERGRGKKRFTSIESLREVAEGIVKRYEVTDLLKVSYGEVESSRPVRGYRGQPATVKVERKVWVELQVDEIMLKQAVEELGWRVYATNSLEPQLSLTEAVWAYRSEYLIERSFGRLKGRPLSLTPMYLERDDHATGLIRLLSIGLRVLTLLEFVARRQLAAEGKQLSGLYAGNPKRATARPTGEQLLAAFKEITLTIWQQGQQWFYHLTPLSKLQQRILALLGFSTDIYNKLGAYSFDST
jgi:transposase